MSIYLCVSSLFFFFFCNGNKVLQFVSSTLLATYECFCLPQVNIYSYSSRKLLHSIETGHSANIFCTKFVPETSDELVVSGAGDAEVML